MLPGCFLSIEYRTRNKKQRPRLIPTEVKRAERISLPKQASIHSINSSKPITQRALGRVGKAQGHSIRNPKDQKTAKR
jgi:hypothetical protein